MSLAVFAIGTSGSAQSSTSATDAPWVTVAVEQTDNPSLNLTASPGSYVMVVRVSDDLIAHVVYPASPAAQQPFPAGPGSFRLPLNVPAYSRGGIYAVASAVPFNFTKISKGDHWDSDALILKASDDPEHAANRVFGLITPATANVAFAETVYMGARTAKVFAGRSIVADYTPRALLADLHVQAGWMPLALAGFGCAGTGSALFSCPSSSSPWIGCVRVSARDVCGSVADIWSAMTATLPPRELVSRPATAPPTR